MTERRVGVTSEIGALRSVICHTPGPELLAVTPSTREDFLYDDIIDLEAAAREHKRFKAILSRFTEVHEVRDLLSDVIDIPEARSFLIERVMDVARSEPLGAFLQELPGEELVSMFVEGREVEEGPLARMLNLRSYALPPLPNLFFTRDAALVVGEGVIIGSMRYNVRWTEEILMKGLFTFHPQLRNSGLIYDGSEERRAGYTLEGGDVHVLRHDTVVMGLSQRSSPGAFDAIADELAHHHGIEHVIVIVMPTDRAMIHLDMIFTMVDRTHVVIFPPAFVGPDRYAVLYYRAGMRSGMKEMPNLFAAMREVDLPLEPVFCGGPRRTFQEREQWSSGCNFVAVRPGVILGYSRNEHTYEELEREADYRIVDGTEYLTGDVEIEEGDRVALVFEGAELVRGGGGARCMTLPVLRDDPW
ncbi:MAG TPA: arginine deiminase family protein [Longimicrobiales bacterium]|nr:arginine deiminase family protein [Longimicrobiales bacterium]